VIEVELASFVINERSDEQLVVLRETSGERELRIVVRLYDALLIDYAFKDLKSPRPLTHELLLKTVEALGASIEGGVIDEREGEIYKAGLLLKRDSQRQRIDARPSDIINLALRGRFPIFSTEEVLDGRV
jgi:bifunctional DNase/RNase